MSKETSFEHNTTQASAESFNAAKHTATYVYRSTESPQTSGLLPNNTILTASCSDSFQLADDGRDSTIPLTRQALQQHDFEHKSADNQRSIQCQHAQYHVADNNMANAVGHTSLSAGYDYLSVGQYFYRQNSGHCPRLFACDTFLKEQTYGYDVGVTPGLPHQPTKLQGSHPYPAFINEEDINHQISSSGAHVDYLAVKQEWMQAATFIGADLAGVGTQFSH